MPSGQGQAYFEPQSSFCRTSPQQAGSPPSPAQPQAPACRACTWGGTDSAPTDGTRGSPNPALGAELPRGGTPLWAKHGLLSHPQGLGPATGRSHMASSTAAGPHRTANYGPPRPPRQTAACNPELTSSQRLPLPCPSRPCPLPHRWHLTSLICINKFSSVQLLSRVRLSAPMNRSMPGLPVHHQLLEFTQTPVH